MRKPKKPPLGRPPVPDADRRDQRVVCLFTVAELARLKRASDDPRLVVWARRVLLEAAAATGKKEKTT